MRSNRNLNMVKSYVSTAVISGVMPFVFCMEKILRIPMLMFPLISFTVSVLRTSVESV